MCFEIRRLVCHPRIARGVTLVECVARKLLPVFPYLLQDFQLMTVLLSAFVEQAFKVVHLLDKFLTHRLAERVRLTARKARQLAAEEHDLLLIDRNAVSIFQVFLHARDVILDLAGVFLTLDKLRDIVHRARSVKGVHGYKVFKNRRLQLAKVLLHTGRFKLERTDGAAVAIEFIGSRVGNGYLVDVEFQAAVQTYIGNGFLNDGQGFQSEEVHLDKSRILDHRTFVLRDEHFLPRLLVVGSRHGHPIADCVAADDDSAGMNAGVPDVAFKHLGILYGLVHPRIGRRLRLSELLHALDCVGKVHLHAVGQTVGNSLAEPVRLGERQLLNPRHVLDGELRRHRSVGYDVRHLVCAVLFGYPVEHLSTSVIIEVGIDIGQGDTVRIEETLEQKVVFDGVYLRNAKTIGDNGAGGAATTRSYHHSELVSGTVDEVLHDKEIARETHRFHYVKLELDALRHLIRQRVAIQFLGSLVSKFGKIVCLKLYSVDLVVASEFLDLLLSVLARHDNVAVLVLRELVIKLFLGVLLAVFVLRSELLRYREKRHDGTVVDAVRLDFIQHFACV